MKVIIYITLILTGLASCTKVIDVDLNESNPKVVIVAEYNGNTSTVSAKVSMTSSYFNSSTSPEITNAVINISDDQGNNGTLTHTANGNYELLGYTPNFGSTYTLTVVHNGDTYTAPCELPAPILLDSVTTELFPGFFGGDPRHIAFAHFQDPASTGDFYQMIISQNGVQTTTLASYTTQDDVLTNGNYIIRPLFSDYKLELGDMAGLELRKISQSVYNYINEASSIEGGSNAAAPANPTTNWNNGALGYFSAFSSSSKTVLVQ